MNRFTLTVSACLLSLASTAACGTSPPIIARCAYAPILTRPGGRIIKAHMEHKIFIATEIRCASLSITSPIRPGEPRWWYGGKVAKGSSGDPEIWRLYKSDERISGFFQIPHVYGPTGDATLVSDSAAIVTPSGRILRKGK